MAFGEALLERLEEDGPLIREAEARSPGARLNHGVYGIYHRHVVLLVSEAAPALDAAYVADALLAALSADVVVHQRRDRGIPLATLVAGWRALVERLLPA
jgi:hypothetical protein